MAGLIDSFYDTLLDEYWGNQSPDTPPATWYIGLFTTNPADDGTGGVEATFTGYTRQAVTNNLTEWPSAVAGIKSNANAVDFGVAGSGPTLVTGIGMWDDPTAGNLWYWNPLTGEPVTIANGGDASFDAGSIVIERC
jgi:hypothetical protein